ncbi:NADP-dependent malic enzyme [Apibacter raozihei]|uniref:NADP-dependent malic enzyme n=1 Tax=Apibacter TaxID=1778601 RepID=UPI000FE3D957|nr:MULTISPECIES: NADP-dependent malic enzyme [Apibacter]
MSKEKNLREAALEYHSSKPEGKIEVVPTKPHSTQRDLALAYSPGVAEPCMEINRNPADAYKYTSKGNLVAVISNGTAVLGLGDIGADASKPVMEGKGLLFKIFAGINVFDIEVNETNPDKFIEIVKSIAPTFGGINLEDIKAPEAFEIEKRLKAELDIPVMHDDQHGTAIISAAALLNALELTSKDISKVKIVVSGAGAAAISCTRLYKALGARPENILMCDSKGVIYKGRTDLNEEKQEFAVETSDRTLEDAMKNSDVFIGLSKGNIVSPSMLTSMNADPIVFAMANPTPEIDYNLAIETRKDVIMATGRSDYPNQVNNVLGFPYIFRGALDVRATDINQEMQLAAVRALAELAKESVPEQVSLAYNVKNMKFGREYIIPKPFDNRLITRVSMAVAKAAMESGVAGAPIKDWNSYEEELLDRLGGTDQKLIRILQTRAKANPKKILLNNAEEYNVLKAAQILSEEGIAKPILLGKRSKIEAAKKNYNLDFDNIPIWDMDDIENKERFEKYADYLYNKRKRNGISSIYQANRLLKSRDYYGPLAVEMGDADALLTGFSKSYKSVLHPILEVIDRVETSKKVASAMIMVTKKGPIFVADTSVNVDPTTDDLVEITQLTANFAKALAIKPRVALLSYENFSNYSPISKKVAKAVRILHEIDPELIVDGEMQPDFALDEELLSAFPFSKIGDKPANVLIFPDLTSANLSFKLVKGLKSSQIIGPVLMGLSKPIQVMSLRSSVDEIVNLATLAVIDAQLRK